MAPLYNSLAKGSRDLFFYYFFFSTYLKWINYPNCTSCSTCNLAYTATHACNAQQQQWNTSCISNVCSKLAPHTGTQRDLLHKTSTMASTKRWFRMQRHAVNSYRKGSGALTFAKTKKIMIQCHTYRDCLRAVCYTREQAMIKQENKKKKKKRKTKKQWCSGQV